MYGIGQNRSQIISLYQFGLGLFDSLQIPPLAPRFSSSPSFFFHHDGIRGRGGGGGNLSVRFFEQSLDYIARSSLERRNEFPVPAGRSTEIEYMNAKFQRRSSPSRIRLFEPAENSDSLGVRAASRPRRNTAQRILIRTRRMAGNARLFHAKVKAGLITPPTRVVSSPRCAVRGKSDRFDFRCLAEHTYVCVCVSDGVFSTMILRFSNKFEIDDCRYSSNIYTQSVISNRRFNVLILVLGLRPKKTFY